MVVYNAKSVFRAVYLVKMGSVQDVIQDFIWTMSYNVEPVIKSVGLVNLRINALDALQTLLSLIAHVYKRYKIVWNITRTEVV